MLFITQSLFVRNTNATRNRAHAHREKYQNNDFVKFSNTSYGNLIMKHDTGESMIKGDQSTKSTTCGARTMDVTRGVIPA